MIKNNVESNKRITLDAKHQEILEKIENEKKNLPSLKLELKSYLREFNVLKTIPKKDLTLEQFNHKYELKKKIIYLKNKVTDIQSDKLLNDYYLKVGTILCDYYNNLDNNDDKNSNQSDDENEEEKEDIKEETKKPNVLDFFNKPPSDTDVDKKETNYTNTKISDFVKTKSNFKRTSMLDEYLQQVDENYNKNIKIDNNSYKCPDCNNEEMILIPSEGIQFCKKCGLQQSIIIESEKPSFKDPPPEICYFSYKRLNHLNEYYDVLLLKIIIINTNLQ